MQGVALPSKVLRQVWVAFPICVEISVGEARETGVICAVIPREAASRPGISIGIANKVRGFRSAREVALAAGIAPSPPRIPVPRLDKQLRVAGT